MRASHLAVITGILLTLGACASSPDVRYADISCGSAMARSDPGPYRPGVTCLAYQGLPETTGARSAGAPMKAVRVDGRIYFVNAVREGPLPPPM